MSLQLTNSLDTLVAEKKAEPVRKESEKPTVIRREANDVIAEVREGWLFTNSQGGQIDPNNMVKRVFHKTLQITVDTYGHMVPGGSRQAVDRLDDDAEMFPSNSTGGNTETGARMNVEAVEN